MTAQRGVETEVFASSYLLFVAAFVAGVYGMVRASIPWGTWAIAVRVAAGIGWVVAARGWFREGQGVSPRRSLLAGVLLAAVITPGSSVVDGSLHERIGEGRMRGVVRARVVSGPEPLERGWGMALETRSIDGEAIPGGPRVRLFVPPDRIAGSHPPLPGDVVEVFARLERYPARRFPGVDADRRRMARRNIAARGIAKDDVEIAGRDGDLWTPIARHLAAARLEFVRAVFDRVSSERARYVVAMTAGARGLLSSGQEDPFRRTGTSHLLAISGLHLGILAGLLWTVFGWIAGRWPALLRRWGRRRVCAVPVLGSLALYVWGIGAPVSAARSLVMVAAVVAALVVMRPVDSLHGLATAALVLLLLEPTRVAGLGFQLSFAATAAILWFLQRRPTWLVSRALPGAERSRTRRWLQRMGTAAGVSASATLATWPILFAWNGWVPLDALWVNLVVTPLVGLTVVPTLFVGAAVTLIAPAVGAPILEVGGWGMTALAGFLSWLAQVPPGPLVSGQFAAGTAVVLQVGVFLWIGSRARLRPLLVGAVVVAVGVGLHALGDLRRSGLRVHFIPVGQGDATLVIFPDDRSLLVDAGGSAFGSDPGRRIVVPYLRRLGIARLDWAIATHADIDHVGGLPAVVDRSTPERLLYDVGSAPSMSDLLSVVEEAETRRSPVRQSVRWRAGGARISVLRPGGADARGDNARSLVTRISYAGRSVLLPGDIEAAGEASLLRRGVERADILKVPHHGSKTSSTPRFLRAVRPRVSVVSAGRFNPFGHPHPSVVRRYRDRDIPLYRTSRNGLVRMRIGGDGELEVRVVRRTSNGRAASR